MMRRLGYLRDNILKARYWFDSAKEVRFFLNRALWEHKGYPWTQLTPKPLEEIFPGIEGQSEPITVVNPFHRRRGTSVELDELLSILSIIRFRSAKRIVEVGTFDGNTALNMALNIDDDGEVVTIDLPPENHDAWKNASDEARRSADKFEERQYQKHDVSSKIRQVYGDSKNLDWTTVGSDFDLAFIDGDHTEPYMRSDTKNVLSIMKPGATVLWHDYEYRSVAKVLDEAAAKGANVDWIAGTRVAVGVFDDPSQSAAYF